MESVLHMAHHHQAYSKADKNDAEKELLNALKADVSSKKTAIFSITCGSA